MQEGGPVAIEQWAEVHKDAFKPPICNKVSSSVCLCDHFASTAQHLCRTL
jgi:hypothetical protein